VDEVYASTVDGSTQTAAPRLKRRVALKVVSVEEEPGSAACSIDEGGGCYENVAEAMGCFAPFFFSDPSPFIVEDAQSVDPQ